MSAARCPYCGDQAMPYRRYALHLKSHATCASCGRAIRVRGFYIAITLGVLVAALMIALSVRSEPGLADHLAALAALAAFGLAVDYAFWRWVGFAPSSQAADTAGTGMPTSS